MESTHGLSISLASAASIPHSGDLLFVRPRSNLSSPLDNAIIAVGNATIEWLRARGVWTPTDETSAHVGIVLRNATTLAIVEATPPAVRLTRWSDFFSAWPEASFYHGRPTKGVAQYAAAAARLALSQLGAPYASDYAPPSSGEFYCSSLVAWAYGKASGDAYAILPTDTPFPLIFVPHAFWQSYYARLNLTLPPANTTGTNPTLLLHGPNVSFEALRPPPAPPLLSTAFTGGEDLRHLAVTRSDGSVLWPAGSLRYRHAGAWHDGEALKPLGAVATSAGADALGPYTRLAQSFDLGASETAAATVELSVRAYGASLVFEQRFPHGLDMAAALSPATAHEAAAADVTGLAPAFSWPSFGLSTGAAASYAWRSWHGTYGSYSGLRLSPNDTLVFNGVPTMPLAFVPPPGVNVADAVLVSPLDQFKTAAHAASHGDEASWRHGPSSRLSRLPAGFSTSVLVIASRGGPTAAVDAWGRAMRHWHRTNRSEALSADVVVRKIGVWTDNGAYYNFNKWAGNRMPGREWSPRTQPSRSPEVLLTRTVQALRTAGVQPGYLQLDDWYYDGVIYEGAVSCVRSWEGARRDWFPSGLAAFSQRLARIPLLLYMPYLCNDTAYRSTYTLATQPTSKTKRGGVPDAPPGANCTWPEGKQCVGTYSLPSPNESARFYADRFASGKANGMVAFEHDFVGQDSLDFGWDAELGAGAQWLAGMGHAASEQRVPMQLCLVTASDLLASLSMPWVTNARASGDYAFCADSWDIGFPSLLHWAVGVRPFKDVMWTTPHQPGSPYENTTLLPSMYKRCLDAKGRHAQPNVRLDALVSAFSTGPVGLGDGQGLTDASLALATCMADGTLLQPAKPLTPLDRTWWEAAQGTLQGKATRELLGSYSRVGTALWQYVVAIDTPCATASPLSPVADLYWPTDAIVGRYAMLHRSGGAAGAWWEGVCKDGESAYTPGSCVSLVAATEADGATTTFRACSDPGAPSPNGTHAWSVTTLAPLLPGAGWALLGEADKFVGVSANRFAGVDGASAARLVLRGVRGSKAEVLRVLVVTPPPKARVLKVEAALIGPTSECTIGAESGEMVCE